MIVLARELDARLDAVWRRLKELRRKPGMSGVELDKDCVEALESYVEYQESWHADEPTPPKV